MSFGLRTWSIAREDVLFSLPNEGGCRREEVSLGEFRFAPAGIGTAWARMPLVAARRVVRKGVISIGWIALPVEALPARPMQCYRCLEYGHSRQRCTREEKPPCCYRCGSTSHLARECSSAPRCPLCVASGKPDGHKMEGGHALAPRWEDASGDREWSSLLPPLFLMRELRLRPRRRRLRPARMGRSPWKW